MSHGIAKTRKEDAAAGGAAIQNSPGEVGQQFEGGVLNVLRGAVGDEEVVRKHREGPRVAIGCFQIPGQAADVSEGSCFCTDVSLRFGSFQAAFDRAVDPCSRRSRCASCTQNHCQQQAATGVISLHAG